MTDVAKDIGLENDLITNTTGQSYIFAKNKLYPIPGGSIMEFLQILNHLLKQDSFHLLVN